jgi:hypothetical protein
LDQKSISLDNQQLFMWQAMPKCFLLHHSIEADSVT